MGNGFKQAGASDGESGRPARSRSSKPRRAQASRRKPTEESVRWAARADRVIEFIEKLTVPSGIGQGEKFHLREWQRRFLRDIYEPCDPTTRRRIVRRAILSVARKNGKSALIAALALVHLIGPEAIHNGEIYSAANDRDQAGIIYKVAAQIVRANAELSALLKCIDSTKTISCPTTGSFYRAVSSESGTKMGLNPTMCIYDELSMARSRLRMGKAYPTSPSRFLYEIPNTLLKATSHKFIS